MDINIHEGSIRRIDTTVSTKEMITDVDVSTLIVYSKYCYKLTSELYEIKILEMNTYLYTTKT